MGVNGRPIQPVELEQAAPQQVNPSPVPTIVNVGQVQAPDGTLIIAMQVQTPVGNAVYFFPPDTARRIGISLQQMGSAGNLLVPG